MYTPQVLDHFQNPRHAGEVEHADAVVEVENPACGDILRLSVRMDGGRVAEARFQAKGCVPAMACGSRITEMMQGRTVAELRALRKEDVVDSLGGVPPASGHAGQLAVDALRALIEKLRL
jgi:nitrogen fixation protein NifU and related proteins